MAAAAVCSAVKVRRLLPPFSPLRAASAFPVCGGETFSSPPPSRAVSSGLPRLCEEAHEGEALETDSPHLLAGLRISAYLHRRRRRRRCQAYLAAAREKGGGIFFAVKLPLSRAANRGSPAERRKIYCRAKARRCELCKTFVAAEGWEKGGRENGSIPGSE